MAVSLWIILLLDCMYRIDSQSVQGSNNVMSKQEAVEKCSSQGKTLANNMDILKNPKSSEYLSQLRNGGSAWIDGYAEWSPFIAWHGCFNTFENWLHVRKFELGARDLFACLKYCKPYNRDGRIRYIGVKNTLCYCIGKDQRDTLRAVNDKLCTTSCSYNAVDSCGGQSYMSVYATVTASTTIRWATGEPSNMPCVYLKKNQTLYNLYTASCHTIEALTISGYFCTHGASSRLVTTACNVTYNSDRYCIIEETVSRQEAFEGCLGWNGIMTDLTGAQHTQKHLANDNKRFWIGLYRTFRLSNTKEPGMVCLAAIKANDILYLEPDDCSRQKHYLCKEKTNLHSSQIASTISNPIGSTTASNATIRKADNETPIAYIIPSILIVILLVAILIFVICWRYKNRSRRISEGTYNTRYKTDNLINEQTVSSVSSDPGQNGESKCLIAKPKPDKPVRQTLKRRTQGAEYENFTLKSEKTESQETKKKKGQEKQKQIDEYDKINFRQRNNVQKEEDEEANVYNHVVDTDNDYYDTMKSTKSSHSLGTCKLDDTYSHMKDCVVNGNYSDLATPDKKQGAETGVNLSENTNVIEKDTTLDTNKQSRFVIVDSDSFEDVPNGDKINEPIIYTEIAEVGVRKEMEYSEITEETDQELDDKLSSESVEGKCGFRLAEKHLDVIVKHVQCNDIDHLKDDEEIILSEVDNAEQKPQLNYSYVDVEINDTVEGEHA